MTLLPITIAKKANEFKRKVEKSEKIYYFGAKCLINNDLDTFTIVDNLWKNVPGRIRTPNTRLRRAMLCPIELLGPRVALIVSTLQEPLSE